MCSKGQVTESTPIVYQFVYEIQHKQSHLIDVIKYSLVFLALVQFTTTTRLLEYHSVSVTKP